MAEPTSYRGLYSSILASPRLLDWPVEVRAWIYRHTEPPGHKARDNFARGVTLEMLGLTPKDV